MSIPGTSLVQIPHHLGIIPDGNRRWARRHGLSVIEGHRRGAEKTVEVLQWCEQAGVKIVTVWALSLDNVIRRPELGGMLTVIAELVGMVAAQPGWRLNVIGVPHLLPEGEITESIYRARDRSSTGTGLMINLAVAYDGREEIVAAVRAALSEGAATDLDAEAVTRRLDQWGQPDCDLILRTSGQYRLSGFLLWQSAPAELYFCSELWPDFTERSFNDAMASYVGRERRFGA
jgi:short-chain Z-isoprenyl diphosphate synthase